VEYAQFFVGHELGHIVLEELGYRENDLETVCDQFGAAVMAPIPAVSAMLRIFGRDHEAIADEVCSTQTWAALRVAECLRIPRAIVTPHRVYARGPEEFVWGPEDELRKLARGNRPGVMRARLTDDPRRVLIDIDDTG
jgi:Zn-dependent peptidase ImmA (M78 family)